MNELSLEIDCGSVRQLLDANEDVLLLDCREEDEYAVAKIAQAQLLPMSQIMDRAAELDPHQNRRVIVHCHHGGRSLQVTQWLRQKGFAQAQNMTGGIDRWSQEIDPTIPRY